MGAYSKEIITFVFVIALALWLNLIEKRKVNETSRKFALANLLAAGLFLSVDLLKINEHALIMFGLTTIILIWEKLKPRVPQKLADPENLFSLQYYLSKTLFTGLFLAFVPMLIPDFHSPLSLTKNNVPFVLQGLIALVVVDFKEYWIHRAQHYFDFYWRFHKAHHFPTKMEPWTSAGTNFIEYFFVQLLSTVAIVKVLDVNPIAFWLFYILPASFFAGVFAHANLDFPKCHKWPFWAYIFASPNSHGYHHTKMGGYTNYGSIFLFWDILFKTIHIPKETPKEFGIDDVEFTNMSLVRQQIHPFLPEKKKTG